MQTYFVTVSPDFDELFFTLFFIIVYNSRVCQWNCNVWSFLSRILHSRHQEIEERLIEEETARRVEELVARRVEEELEKRRDEIEHEVLRRVEEAKRIMEAQLLQELERQRQAELNAQKTREVTLGRSERSGAEPHTRSRGTTWHSFLHEIEQETQASSFDRVGNKINYKMRLFQGVMWCLEQFCWAAVWGTLIFKDIGWWSPRLLFWQTSAALFV